MGKEDAVKLNVVDRDGSQLVIEAIPVLIQLFLSFFIFDLLPLFVALVAAYARPKRHVGHECSVYKAEISPISQHDRNFLRFFVTCRRQ